MKISEHPVWLVGFRPFFILAALSGLILPLLWAFIYNGMLILPLNSFSTVQWHAHEMFFGFGWAVLGGFLLTSTKNWVKIRGFYGPSLIYLSCLWILERIGMFLGSDWSPLFFLVTNNIFLVSITLMIVGTLVRYRNTDTYRDNIFFIMIIPLFILSKNLMLSSEYFKLGTSMTIGLFRMAFLLMLERTITQFMKSTFQAEILRNYYLDILIKIIAFLMVFESLLPTNISTGLRIGLLILLAFRLFFWKLVLSMKRIEIAVMYLAYIAIMINLVLQIPFLFTPFVQIFDLLNINSVAVHVFTFGAMGLVIPAMMIRICHGHTGRKIVFDFKNKLILWIMILAFVLRIIGPQIAPNQYSFWIFSAALCWCVSFSLIAWNYIPFLLQARVDGKEH